MNRITHAFTSARGTERSFIVPYITPEFPVKGTTVPMILALAKAGASMIEIGIPFADPLADGPTIQHSSETAIGNGVNIPFVFRAVQEARVSTNIPLILMGYYNPILHYGVERFVADAASAGVDGFIVPDLPPEESDEFRKICAEHRLSNVFLVAPTSSDERIRFIDRVSTDFTYCVSVTGVTGARNSHGGDLDGFLKRVRKNTTKPFVVGFGIRNRGQVEAISRIADGVVVGSALIQSMQNETTVEGSVSQGESFLRSLQ